MLKSTRFMVDAAVIAALYAALTLALAPISFGALQIRVSEALTILPVFTAAAIPGLTVGCLIANAAGLAMGANIAGPWDLLFGTCATLLAALCTYLVRKIRAKGIPVFAVLPPVILNAVVIGWELYFFAKEPLILSVAWVGLGQIAACCAIGLPLEYFMRKKGVASRLFTDYKGE